MQQSILCAATALALWITSGVSVNAEQKPLTLNRPASDFKFKPSTRAVPETTKPTIRTPDTEVNRFTHDVPCSGLAHCPGGWAVPYHDKQAEKIAAMRRANMRDANLMRQERADSQSQRVTKRLHDSNVAKGKTACAFGNCPPAYRGQAGNSASQPQGNAAMDRLQGM